jgi:hypothetical protein
MSDRIAMQKWRAWRHGFARLSQYNWTPLSVCDREHKQTVGVSFERDDVRKPLHDVPPDDRFSLSQGRPSWGRLGYATDPVERCADLVNEL